MIIRKLRLQQGWTQQELAHFSGLSIRTVQRIEKGQLPSEESAKCLGAVFDVDAADILAYFEDHAVVTEQSPKQENGVMAGKLKMTYDEERAMREVEDLKSLYVHATSYALIVPIFWIMNFIWLDGGWWAIWPTLGWGLGLAGHAASVYNPLKLFGPEWERKQIEKRLNKQD